MCRTEALVSRSLSVRVVIFGRCTAAAATMPLPYVRRIRILLFELNVHGSYGPVVLHGRRLDWISFHFRLQARDFFLMQD